MILFGTPIIEAVKTGREWPRWLAFLKAYEERELEIRFGEPYLHYKARTPMLLAGKPK